MLALPLNAGLCFARIEALYLAQAMYHTAAAPQASPASSIICASKKCLLGMPQALISNLPEHHCLNSAMWADDLVHKEAFSPQ